ncbi:deoxynucleoside monophosphate kinase [Bacillus phage vB_BpsS-36]|uniref:Deoxynucleoside monophosphate kinase n=1 Tax=Bacillus phage vB_BpsS-36 TaxID=2419622 RepID=A0A3G3BX26_9CAUD|nr:deoxynucleoside monophosphate kinase [Bacillus phage vB_BpsS-36]
MSMGLKDFYREPLPNIGLFAKMRSGKDEVYKVISFMGFNVERVAFGDIMKERFYELFPLIPPEPKPISELVAFGQSMRAIDNDVWVRPTMARMKVRTDILAQAGFTPPAFIVTDIRQPNEYEACKRAGMVMVKVHADESVRVERMLALGEKVSREVLDSPTELHIDGFKPDYVINNNGTPQELAKEITELIYKIQTKRNDV